MLANPCVYPPSPASLVNIVCLVVRHLPHHDHNIRDAVLHLRPDLNDTPVVGDELLRGNAERGVTHHRLHGPAGQVGRFRKMNEK